MVNPGESVFFGSPAPASMQRGMRSPSTPLSTGGARYLDGGFGESAWGAGGSTPAQREAGGGYRFQFPDHRPMSLAIMHTRISVTDGTHASV